jgi:hypothetical protein
MMRNERNEELLRQAARLEMEASINDVYRAAMERTAERTGGRLGSLNAPKTYQAHIHAGEMKRLKAAQLRRQAAGTE